MISPYYKSPDGWRLAIGEWLRAARRSGFRNRGAALPEFSTGRPIEMGEFRSQIAVAGSRRWIITHRMQVAA